MHSQGRPIRINTVKSAQIIGARVLRKLILKRAKPVHQNYNPAIAKRVGAAAIKFNH